MPANELYTVLNDSKERLPLFAQYFDALIKEREQGELSLSIIGNDLITLIGQIEMPPAKLIGSSPDKKLVILDKIYGLAGRLDMTEQGGTTPAEDEELWQEFKQEVEQYRQAVKA